MDPDPVGTYVIKWPLGSGSGNLNYGFGSGNLNYGFGFGFRSGFVLPFVNDSKELQKKSFIFDNI